MAARGEAVLEVAMRDSGGTGPRGGRTVRRVLSPASNDRPAQNRRMFAPSQHDVREFFCSAQRKQREGSPLTPIEALATDWIARHPEYEPDLADVESALAADYPVEAGRTNPFLHLAMHLSIEEQVSIDQPRGIRQAVDLLAARLGSAHAAHHEVMECLGEMLWASQKSGLPPDGERYLECVRRRATR
jgi:Domain of unknown function (DUF1841)